MAQTFGVPTCHPERSEGEGSRSPNAEILSGAKDDNRGGRMILFYSQRNVRAANNRISAAQIASVSSGKTGKAAPPDSAACRACVKAAAGSS
jgi:hypothetical protein